MMLRAATVFWGCVFVSSAAAQATSLDCTPPLRPLTYEVGEFHDDMRDNARAEFATYFDEAQTYLNCLVAAQDAARSEIAQVLEDYSETFGE